MPRDQRLHQVSISTVTSLTGRPSTVKTRFETVAVDSIVAQREDHQTWGCQPVTPDQKPQVYTYLVLVPPHPHSVETIGPGTLRGTPIWWVRMTQAPGYTLMGPILLAIAQDSYRLVEESVAMGVKGANPGQMVMLIDYSRYGETVSVHLPAACPHG